MEKSETKGKVLVVDDEEAICDILQYNLKQAGFLVETANSAEEALFKFKNRYDLLLLDIMMEGISGLKLAKMIREEYNSSVPIIFITALDSEQDLLTGFGVGADDYIAKPFSVKEVVARVKAVLSRSMARDGGHPVAAGAVAGAGAGAGASAGTGTGVVAATAPLDDASDEGRIVVGELVIETSTHRVFLSGSEIALTRTETDILELLATNQGKIFSREDILDRVWKGAAYVLERTVDVHIARLRKKLGNCGNMIVNRSGYGYSFKL